HRDHSRELVGEPRLLERCARRSASPASRRVEAIWRVEPEMALDVVHRIADGGRLVVAREKHRCADVDRTSPELCERRTLELESLHVLVVRGDCNRWDDLVRDQL